MKKFLLQTLIVYAIVIGTWLIYRNFFERKIYFVNLNTVYEKFEYKKTLEKQLEQVMVTKNNILDSLKAGLEIEYRQLQGLRDKITDEQKQRILNFKAANQEYVQKKDNFDKTNEQLYAQYDKQIWTQINEFVDSYGKEKNVGIIVGSNGSGSVMYSDLAFDITDDVVAYINLKHLGH